MRVLVTGGSGVIGEGLIPHLLEAGHHVRLLTRRADAAARAWPEAVESFAADITDPQQLLGAADSCEAVVHVTGVVVEQPPEVTFQRVNVEGTQHLLAECDRAGRPRLVYISSLGAERGRSPYHVSKREAEALVRAYSGDWVIMRPGNVYGPGDDVISQLLSLHRTLPVVPVIGAGDHPFQPIWYLDLGLAIGRALEADVAGTVHDVAGEDVTTANELFGYFEELTGRSPLRIPVPEALTALTTRMAEAVGMPFPISESQFQMLIEENVVQGAPGNALTRVFQVTPTPLREALALLVDRQKEQTPDEGVGSMERKRFWGDITRSPHTAETLLELFRARCTELLPIEFDAEPDTKRAVNEGATLTARLPLRGNIQIRVVEVTPRAVTFATLRGHPLAGVVRFTTSEPAPGVLRFMVSVFARAASMMDWLALNTVGGVAQNSTWRTGVERLLDVSGGTSSGVEEETGTASGAEDAALEAWIVELVARHQRTTRDRVPPL